MGCSSSTEVVSGVDAAVARVVAKRVSPVDAAFCSDKPTTLYLQEKFWLVPPTEDFLICCVETGREVFCVQGSSSSTAMKTLRDAATRAPIVHLKRDSVRLAPTFNAFSAQLAVTKLFTIEVHGSNCEDVTVEFINKATGEKCRMGMTGRWTTKQATLWVERGGRHKREEVARIYRPSRNANAGLAPQLQDDYFVGVVAEIDLALVVLVCMALDEASGDRCSVV